MSLYTRGDVVILPFPYSGAPGEKPRPALVLAAVPYASRMTLRMTDVTAGVLRKQCCLRPAYLFTTSENRVSRKVAS